MDYTLISYTILKWAAVYNLVLFLIWLIMVKRSDGMVSDIYVIVMALFGARLFGIMIGIYARSLRGEYDHFGHSHNYIDFMDTILWRIRLLPEAAVFIVLGIVLTRRFIYSYFFQDPDYKTVEGRRKTD